MSRPDIAALLSEEERHTVLEYTSGCFVLPSHSPRGPDHWHRVRHNGLLLAGTTGVNRLSRTQVRWARTVLTGLGGLLRSRSGLRRGVRHALDAGFDGLAGLVDEILIHGDHLLGIALHPLAQILGDVLLLPAVLLKRAKVYPLIR